MKKAIFPGSFDPITIGHDNVIEQASVLFDEIYIAVLPNSMKKTGLFTIEERIAMIKEVYANNPKIKVIESIGATTDIATQNECIAIIRGVRNEKDLSYEKELAFYNRRLSNNKIITAILLPDAKYEYISSTAVRELHSLGKDTSEYIHPIVEKKLQKKKFERI